MHTVLGSILDPAADKALMTTLTVTLAAKSMLPRMSPHSCSFFPSTVTTLLTLRCLETSVASDNHHRP